MNPIELEWQHIKKDELAGQMFEDELELAYAVINGVEARGKKGNRTYATGTICVKRSPRQGGLLGGTIGGL